MVLGRWTRIESTSVQTVKEEDSLVNRETASKATSKLGIAVINPRAFVTKTTNADHECKFAPDRVHHKFSQEWFKAVWASEFTYLHFGASVAYL